tara:strand:+ start:286 stop:681 length:396 start_codon:yes stop_codon:yes gene_type:complete
MIKIYCIVDINGLKYIGSTSQQLHRRLVTHKQTHTRCSSVKLDLYNSFMYTIEECDEEHRKIREQYWIDNTDCVNIRNTTFDEKKYKKGYVIKNKEYKKQYDNVRRNWNMSWGETKRDICNLTYIKHDLFN